MQSRRAAIKQFLAQRGDYVNAKSAYGRSVVPIAFELNANPARDLRAASIGKSCELGKIADWHDARHDWNLDPYRQAFVHKAKVGIRIIKILRNGRVRTGINLELEILELVGRISGLRVVFRITRDVDVEPIAGGLAYESHQLIGIFQFASGCKSGWHVAAQCN